MAELINEIIAPEAFAQLQELRGELDESAKSLKELAKSAQNLDFSKVKSLSELGQWAQNYEKTIDAMAAANNNYSESAKKVEAAKQRQIRAIEIAEAKEMTAIQRTIAEQEKKAQREEALLNKMVAAEEKANAKAIAAQQKRAQQEEKILNKMIADEEKAAQRKQKIQEQAAKEAEKAMQREEIAIGKLSNDYELLKKAYSDAANKAKELGVTFGTNSQVFKDAASNAKVMYDRLLKVEMAVGQGQRAVGQYNQAAFAMQQILRETPAFAYSFGTGILAISNNIPILVDEITRLKQANEELKASGAKTIPIWKTLLQGVLSPSGLITLGVGVFTLLATNMDLFKSKTKDAADETKKLNDELRDIDRQAQHTAAAEQSRIEILAATAKNTALSMDVRINAVKELQKLYPDYLGNLNQEKILTGEITKELDDLNRAITARSMMTAIGDKMTKEYEKIIAAEAEIANIREKTMPSVGGASPTTFLYGGKSVKEFQGEIAQAEQNIKQYEKLVDKYASAAGKLLKPPPTKDTVKGGGKDTTLKSESDLLQAIYDNKQKELEITRDTNKAIADDTKQEMADRLVAHENYLAAVLELARNERDRTIDLEGEKLDEIDRLKQKAKGKELANLIEQQRAAMIRVNTAQMEFNGKRKEVIEAGQKSVIDIVASSNNEWAKDEEKKNEKLKEMQLQAYLVEEELLRRALDGKEITSKEYNTRLKDLQKKQNIAFLQNEVELYDKLLANEQLADDKREEYRKKRNAAQKSLFNAQQGEQTKKGGRITDSLGMMLGLGSEDELQAFYDNAVNLANTAADAIIAARKRQYQADVAMLDAQMEKVRSNYDMQLNLIDATSKTQEEKANRVAKLNSQRAEQEAAIEEKKKQMAIRQARFEKSAAAANIIANTAVAITKAIAQFTVAAPPIVALIAAAGAAQLASVLSAPIPAYKEGTDNHIGGAFIAGDGGEPELIVAPNKRPYWSNSVSTLYNEGAGTKVIPMSDIMQYTTTNTEDFSAAQLDALATRIAKSFDKTGYKIAQVMQATKPQINMDAIAQQMRRERNLQGK